MSINIDNLLLTGSILLLLSILTGTTSSRFGIPTLIFFLFVGILAGSEGLGGIHFEDPKIAQFVGISALNFILFSGGLDTNFKSIRPILRSGILLSTLGVCITAVSLGLFVHLVLDFTIAEGLLLGAIVSSTDAAAVFSILRSKGVALKGFNRPLLELESGSNDPMAYFLTISLTTFVAHPEMGFWNLVPLFFKGIIIGTLLGYVMGKLMKLMINTIVLNSEGLYPVLVLALAIFTYSGTEFLGGNGFLAVYLAAVILGNSNIIHKRTLIKFFDGQAWLMQIILFLTLGLLVFPSQILPVAGIGLIVALFLILVARPLGVFISLAFSGFNRRSKLFISWVGLRGAVPIVFATYPMIAGIEKSQMIFNIVFFIAVTSILIQGTTITYMAKLLHLIAPAKAKRRIGTDFEFSEKVKSRMEQVTLPADSGVALQKIVQIDFPKTANIMAIKRNNVFITPVGSTVLQPGDTLYILAEDDDALKAAYSTLKMPMPQ
ncbi:potassium/proton antiporter [Aridibaculum aurantiacum]|uniref:potassium/proton antiporter n=1 Tax=Aridibaculum aurantiacum TaxID=2810307 RepID=UPI001A957715|nr:potassium/proton antiporter [Aridibaculum aurantiacum]